MAYCAHTFVATPTIPVCLECGQTPQASPSQIESWRGCQRKHAYRRSRPRTQNRFAEAGTQAHDMLESWLRDAIPPPVAEHALARAVAQGLHLLPMPRTPGLVVEHNAKPMLLGVQWNMKLDYLYGYVPGEVVCIGDHKTTRSISEFAKTPETLATEDPQGLAYAYWAAEEFNVPRVVGQWTYYQRDGGAKPKPVVFVVARDEVRERFTAMHHADVVPMVRSRTLAPEELPRNLEHCTAFGGCAFVDECHAGITPHELASAALVQLRRPAAQETAA